MVRDGVELLLSLDARCVGAKAISGLALGTSPSITYLDLVAHLGL